MTPEEAAAVAAICLVAFLALFAITVVVLQACGALS
jgi:hypothetical protein